MKPAEANRFKKRLGTNVWGRPLDYWFTMNHTYDNGNECHEKPE